MKLAHGCIMRYALTHGLYRYRSKSHTFVPLIIYFRLSQKWRTIRGPLALHSLLRVCVCVKQWNVPLMCPASRIWQMNIWKMAKLRVHFFVVVVVPNNIKHLMNILQQSLQFRKSVSQRITKYFFCAASELENCSKIKFSYLTCKTNHLLSKDLSNVMQKMFLFIYFVQFALFFFCHVHYVYVFFCFFVFISMCTLLGKCICSWMAKWKLFESFLLLILLYQFVGFVGGPSCKSNVGCHWNHGKTFWIGEVEVTSIKNTVIICKVQVLYVWGI